ncbi:helix-turn-helix domain-containing protein [Aquamicrobium zhengzhouense]|uniref:Helix-turn-helix domain-containing protein n=1 Tax=Aquamicrobium zhengzhouense TaxID=2781738 RepID=A0ABS0SA14_9HYPH|nr:helix-turn-helix domain-containing protein [Aquamicrobium zhengzhouense]MBI1620121.1 helix-turn-helix domain-containing protein [Aquamicrobium zhengzhouense]
MSVRENTARNRRKAVVDQLRKGMATSDQMAAQFGVCPRTIYHDITILRKHGFRIDGAAGLGYMLRKEPERV